MSWTVLYHNDFYPELEALPEPVQNALLSAVTMLVEIGPRLGRPHADTLGGSKHANMKELRFTADNGAWRVAFAFDPIRRGIVLVAGDKAGVAQKRFYKVLIAKADKRFDDHLEALNGPNEAKG